MRIGVGRVVIIRSTKLLRFYVEVRTASPHRDKRASRLWGDLGIILFTPITLPVRKVRLRRGKGIVQDHTARLIRT